MASKEEKLLQFSPFSSALDTGFWHQLTQLKLDVFQLDDAPQPLTGYFFNGDASGIPSHLNLDYNAFQPNFKVPIRHFPSRGFIKNTNTLNDFKTIDKRNLLDTTGKEIWQSIVSGEALENPTLLSRFLLLTFADLKKYNFFYWFAFPALCAPEKITVKERKKINQVLTDEQVEQLLIAYDKEFLPKHVAFFLGKKTKTSFLLAPLKYFDDFYSGDDELFLCVCDPCNLDDYPGWPLRVFLTLAAYHWSEKLGGVAKVLCLRDRFKEGVRSVDHSLVFTVDLPSISHLTESPRCIGWEKNERGKLGPRIVNLGPSMDPSRLAESAVDLNLKLMRWRLLPSLDLDLISETRCLLLGAGTLGCNVARSLMAWGVRTITFVDNGSVSYSNPVRQTLFTFEDSMNGGRPKAECAAESLRKIFPGVRTEGHVFSIPMPGHSVTDGTKDHVKRDVERLEHLIEDHDAVFLLMDTRESRWLPTLIATAKTKIVINAALGFDTFLVVRHGVRLPQRAVAMETSEKASLTQSISGHQLGCYFCNDVVAPGDSTRDRTLDQQCTVARPGLSMMTSALAVELLISLLTHPQRGQAPADIRSKDEELNVDTECPLGLVPHQIRGFLSRFNLLMPTGQAFDQCTACSNIVVEEYRKKGFEFLLNAFNEPSYLEDLTGLSEMHLSTMDEEVWGFSDDEEM